MDIFFHLVSWDYCICSVTILQGLQALGELVLTLGRELVTNSMSNVDLAKWKKFQTICDCVPQWKCRFKLYLHSLITINTSHPEEVLNSLCYTFHDKHNWSFKATFDTLRLMFCPQNMSLILRRQFISPLLSVICQNALTVLTPSRDIKRDLPRGTDAGSRRVSLQTVKASFWVRVSLLALTDVVCQEVTGLKVKPRSSNFTVNKTELDDNSFFFLQPQETKQVKAPPSVSLWFTLNSTAKSRTQMQVCALRR